MRRRLFICIILLWGSAYGGNPPSGKYLDASSPLIAGLYALNRSPALLAQEQDTLGAIDVNSPNYRFPGRAMMLSLAVPGLGQLTVGEPKRTVFFLAADVIAVLAWDSYAKRGTAATQVFKDSADVWWDFKDWLRLADDYYGDVWGTGKDQIYVGAGPDATHHLEFFVDMDGNGIPEEWGNTKEDQPLLDQLLADPVTRDSVKVKKSNEYYENIGKYNEFFSGWKDADSDTNKSGIRIEERTSGLIALTPHRSKYLHMRADANRLMSTATYAISALMFNHVVSAVDAIFATARWNREHARRLSGRLLFHRAYRYGIGGIQLSLAW